MKILVANLGSTSFKYRLFDMNDERQLARGGTVRIGSPESKCFVEIAGKQRRELTAVVPDHAVAVRHCLEQLTDPQEGCLKDGAEVAAIGFKAVHGGRYSGAQRVTPDVLTAKEEMSRVAPAHNPPYIAAMRLLSEKLPESPLVAAFETGFHQTIPARNKFYAVPYEWADAYQVRRWGFHGASHRYIGGRCAELLGRKDLRVTPLSEHVMSELYGKSFTEVDKGIPNLEMEDLVLREDGGFLAFSEIRKRYSRRTLSTRAVCTWSYLFCQRLSIRRCTCLLHSSRWHHTLGFRTA